MNVLQSSVKRKQLRIANGIRKHIGWHAVSVYLFASCQFSNTCIAYQTGVSNKILLRILLRVVNTLYNFQFADNLPNNPLQE